MTLIYNTNSNVKEYFEPGDLVVVVVECGKINETGGVMPFHKGDIGLYLEDAEPNDVGDPCGNILIKGIKTRFTLWRLKRYEKCER